MSSKKNFILYTLCRDWKTGLFKWSPVAYTREKIIDRLAINLCYQPKESIIDNLEHNMDATTCEITSYYGYVHKYYLVKVNSDIETRVDASELRTEVLKKCKEIEEKRARKHAKYVAMRRLYNCYEFRKDPVPGVHNWHHGRYYRNCQNQRTKRQQAMLEIEYPEFAKPKDRACNLPVWDDRVRHRDRSWKTSFKVRKQWMKHMKQ